MHNEEAEGWEDNEDGRAQLQRDSPLLGYSEDGTLDAVFEAGFCT